MSKANNTSYYGVSKSRYLYESKRNVDSITSLRSITDSTGQNLPY